MTLGLVLSGGGANGAFEAGVLQAIEEAGLTPTILSGTSAGALNAAGLAAGLDADRIAELWRSISNRSVFRGRRDLHRLLRPLGLLRGDILAERLLNAVGWTYLLETAPLRRTLTGILGDGPLDVPEHLVLVTSAVEEATGALVRFTTRRPPPHRDSPRYRVGPATVDQLMASAAIPLAFRPGEVDGTRFWDGGLVANTPLAPALAYEPDRVIIVTTATRPRPAAPPHNLGEAISLLIDNILAHSLAADLARAEAVNRICELDPDDGRKIVDFLLIEPTGLDLGNGLDFAPRHARRRIAAGRELGRRRLEGWLGR